MSKNGKQTVKAKKATEISQAAPVAQPVVDVVPEETHGEIAVPQEVSVAAEPAAAAPSSLEQLKAERLALSKRTSALRKAGSITKEEDAALSRDWRELSRKIHLMGGKQVHVRKAVA